MLQTHSRVQANKTQQTQQNKSKNKNSKTNPKHNNKVNKQRNYENPPKHTQTKPKSIIKQAAANPTDNLKQTINPPLNQNKKKLLNSPTTSIPKSKCKVSLKTTN